jgi:ketosteroid isomerase-like protein
MSWQNVEIVRGAYEAWNAGAVPALRQYYDPDIVLTLGYAEEDPVEGLNAVMGVLAQLRGAWGDDAMEPLSFIDAGNRVVVHHIWRAHGRGPDLDIEQAMVFTLRDGKIRLVETFWDHQEALRAVGLGG